MPTCIACKGEYITTDTRCSRCEADNTFLFTYALRFSAREYELLRQVREGRPLSLALMALLAFTLALIMALAVAFTLEADEESLPTMGLTRVTLTIAFSLIFVNVTLSAMLMAIRDFARRLNELVPQPVFLQEESLVRLILKSAWEKFGGGTSLELVEMNRMEGGMVQAVVKRSSQPTPPSAEEPGQWEIEADKWGQILSLKLSKQRDERW